jgi:MSHA biogenesis protein MshJ
MMPLSADSLSGFMTRWRRWRRAFDARLTTERRLLIVAAACVTWFALDTVWVTPSYQRMSKAIAAKRAAESSQQSLASQQTQIAAAMATQQRDAQAQLAQLRERVAKGEKDLSEVQSQLAPAREMGHLLEAMLARHGQLRLQAMRTLAPIQVHLGQGDKEAGLLYNHGMEMVVQGSYQDLVTWLQSVEGMPRHLVWDSMKLSSDDQARLSLHLQVHTLSPDKDALEIAP